MKKLKNLLLFDIDGTLTKPRQKYDEKIINLLKNAKTHFDIAIVGGSDRKKQIEQLENTVEIFKYCFPENGTMAYKNGELFHQNSISKHFGEKLFQRLINFILKILSETEIEKKRGTFIEYRNGLINVSIIGRACSQEERDEFVIYNKKTNIMKKIRQQILKEFEKDGIYVSIGGQISMDIFPNGWDKTYCLKFLNEEYKDIHFIGDKCYEGGNDYEIYMDERTIGHWVKGGPDDTVKIVKGIIEKYK